MTWGHAELALERACEREDAGVVRVDVTAARPLAQLGAVHRDAEAGRVSGKTVLIP